MGGFGGSCRRLRGRRELSALERLLFQPSAVLSSLLYQPPYIILQRPPIIRSVFFLDIRHSLLIALHAQMRSRAPLSLANLHPPWLDTSYAVIYLVRAAHRTRRSLSTFRSAPDFCYCCLLLGGVAGLPAVSVQYFPRPVPSRLVRPYIHCTSANGSCVSVCTCIDPTPLRTFHFQLLLRISASVSHSHSQRFFPSPQLCPSVRFL